MPVCTSIPRQYPTAHGVPEKYALVLSCVDYRLLDDLVRFLDHDNLTNRYYHLTLAGAALGAVRKPPKGAAPLKKPALPPWRDTFVQHVNATVELTHGTLTDIYIVQHANCGAFRLYVEGFEDMSAEDEEKENKLYAAALRADILEHFCDEYNPLVGNTDYRVQEKYPKVHQFYIDLRGNVTGLGKPYSFKCEKKCPVCKCPEPANKESTPDE